MFDVERWREFVMERWSVAGDQWTVSQHNHGPRGLKSTRDARCRPFGTRFGFRMLPGVSVPAFHMPSLWDSVSLSHAEPHLPAGLMNGIAGATWSVKACLDLTLACLGLPWFDFVGAHLR